MLKNIFEPNVQQNQAEAAQTEAAAKQAAKAEEESQLAQKAAEEEATENKLRESISDIDTKILQFQSLLEAMKNSNDAALTAVGSATERKKTLETKFKDLETQFKDLLANPDYRQVLEAQGLHSVNDLLANEQYNQEEDVVNFQRTKQEKSEQYEETRTKIQERREIKNQAIEAVSQETGEPVKKMNQQETIQAVTNLVEVLQKNRKELFDKTPEGKEAIKQEVLGKIDMLVTKDDRKSNIDKLKDGSSIDNFELPSNLIKDLIKLYGEDLTKETLKEYLQQRLNDNIDQLPVNQELAKKEVAVDYVSTFREGQDQLRKKIAFLETLKESTQGKIAQALENNEEALIKARNYFGFNGTSGTSKQIAEELLKQRLYSSSYNQSAFEYLKKTFREAQGDEDKAILNKDNDPRIGMLLASRLESILSNENIDPDNFYPRIDKPDTETLDYPNVETLRDVVARKVDKYGIEILGMRNRLEKSKTELQGQVEAKFEALWHKDMLRVFRHQNEIDGIQSQQKKQENAQLFLADFNVNISGVVGKLRIDEHGALSFADTDPYEIDALQDKINEKQKEIKEIKQKIVNLDEEAKNAGMDVFGTKKKKREEEKSKLQESLSNLSTELENMTIEYDKKNTRNQELDGLRKSMRGINIKLNQGDFTPQDFRAMVNEQMNFSLTEEQTELLKKDKELEEQAVLAEKSYTTKVRSGK